MFAVACSLVVAAALASATPEQVSWAVNNPFALEVKELRTRDDELAHLTGASQHQDLELLNDIEAQLEREATSNSTAVLSRQRRNIAFPTGSYVQLDFQLVVPFYTVGDFSEYSERRTGVFMIGV